MKTQDQLLKELRFKNHFYTTTGYSVWEKLILSYMVDNDVEYFKSTTVYKKIGMPKSTWNKYVKRDLIQKGMIVQQDRYNYRFLDASKLELY